MQNSLPVSPHWWQWPTVLSLDAPAVAVVWQWLLARVGGVAVTSAHAFILGTSVWLAYAADRWIEGWRLDPDQTQTQRHRFYQRRRWPVAVVWMMVLTADVSVAVRSLDAREFNLGLGLLAPVLIYLLSHQLVHRDRRWRAPKEICVAALLSGGVALFPVAQPSAALHLLAVPLGLFTLLCFANCALISVWEHEVDETHGQTSLAHQFQHGATVGHTLPWMLALVAGVMAAVESGEARTAAICAAVSGGLLGALDLAEPRVGRQAARVLADAALLTPLGPILAAALGSR